MFLSTKTGDLFSKLLLKMILKCLIGSGDSKMIINLGN